MSDNEIHRENERLIQEQGFAVMASFPRSLDDPPPFAYSLGLTETEKHPEIIVFGLSAEIGISLVADLARRVTSSHEPLPVDTPLHDVVEHYPVLLKRADAAKALNYAAFTQHRYRSGKFSPQFLQLVWPDVEGRFPWEAGFSDRMKAIQPFLFNLE